MGYTQKNNPFPVTSCGRRRTYMQDGGKPKKEKMGKEEKMSFNEKNSSLNQAIIKEIERKNNLKKVENSPIKKADPRKTIGPGKNFNKANPTGTGADAGGGMTQKGVNEYKRNNPGSKLKTAVTTKPSKLKPGSKAAGRRKSFCARSKGWTGERGRAARRRWNC